jgi:acyl-CoA synthetase (AMP-forming)/AMP-acid ligase II
MLRQGAQAQPKVVGFNYLLDGETEQAALTFGELDRQARIVAAKLQSLEAAGERALLLYAPGLDYITAFFGCLFAGTVAVPTYPPDVTRLERTLPRFLSIIESAQPKIALTTRPILDMAQMLLRQYPGLQEITWLATDDLAAASPDSDRLLQAWQNPDVDADSLAFLQYTSGSTAAPKGVMLTHGNLLHNMRAICDAFGIVSEKDSAMFWLPFYHDMGLIGGVLAPIYCGVTNTLMSPLDFLQRPLRWLQAISRTHATVSGGPNFAYDLCVRKVRPEQKAELDLSSWRLAFNGAEPIRAGTFNRFTDAFAECGFRKEAFFPCYGLAEATVFVSGIEREDSPLVLHLEAGELANGRVVTSSAQASADLEDDSEVRSLVGCGWTRTDHNVVIVDPEELVPCEEDEPGTTAIGEIWVSGPSIARGYWDLPQESQRVFSAKLDGDPVTHYMRTGDLGFIKDGQLFIAGRLKDLIIIDGLNHYPQDIELTVENCHPALRPGCSAAFSTEINNRERLVIVAEIARSNKLKTLQEETDLAIDAGAIERVVRGAVASNHDLRVQDVLLLKPGTVPKTSSGKIQRHASKQGYLEGTLEIWG